MRYGTKGNFDAVEQFQKAIEINPGYFQAHYNLGLAYQGLRKFDFARREFQAALELQPDYKPAQAALKKLEKVRA